MSKDSELDDLELRLVDITERRSALGDFDTNAADILAMAQVLLTIVRKLRDPYGFRRRK